MLNHFFEDAKEYLRGGKQKGDEFERYIAECFVNCDFTILDWSTDNYDKRRGIKVKSNSNPDLLVQDKETRQKFAVECKYRKTLEGLGSKIAEPYQIDNYRNFMNRLKIQTYILLGVGGKSNKPEDIYLIHVDSIKSNQFEGGIGLEDFKEKPPFIFYVKGTNLTIINQDQIL